MKKGYWILLLTIICTTSHLQAQIASFNFSATANVVTGWTNVAGDPYSGAQTATAGGITISSVSPANWSPNSNNNCAINGFGASSGTYFPAAVMSDSWIQYNGSANDLALYNALLPQLELTGLNADSTYILRMTGSNAYFQGPTQYTVAGSSVSGSQTLTTYNNTSQGITFQAVQPDNNGMIRIYVNCPTGLTGTSFAWICGLQVFSGSANVGTPQVAISAPASGTIFPEGGNVTINATASEPGSAIAKVEFYADTTKIGEVDAAPYNFTWVGPDPGSYQLAAKATDISGTINTASVNIAVTSLNYFWSTTGNIGNNGDSNFVGNVDSVRLGFRTKNIERLSILPTGNIGIGTITPTAQFHTTGTVRLAGLTSDNTKTRVLVSDSLGNISYSTSGTGGGHWVALGGTYYDSADNIGIGTSNPQGYKLAVNGTGIFVKVIAKPNNTWPDYVFKKGFVLPDLGELERYIGEHHHLPGIISEQEVQQQGIDLGGQHTALLKEVEELTLYLIRENKALAEQNARLEAQQKEIDELKAMIRANNNH
jgi:hypothetical protein